jgi:hypothetical protein
MLESSNSAGATAGGSETRAVSAVATRLGVRLERVLRFRWTESFLAGRMSAGVAAGVLESFDTACRVTAAGVPASEAGFSGDGPAASARWFAVQPNATAATMLAAHAAR